MPSVPSAGPGPGAEGCGAVSGAGAGRGPSSGRPLGQYSRLLLRVPYGTRQQPHTVLVVRGHGRNDPKGLPLGSAELPEQSLP